MTKRIDETGNKYNRLTVLGFSHHSNSHEAVWKCLCRCGTECYVAGHKLRDKRTQSCGCLRQEHIEEVKSGNILPKCYQAYRRWVANDMERQKNEMS